MLATVLALALLQAAPDQHPPRVLRAGAGEAFATPAAALAAARPGDTIRVRPGVYRGALAVAHPVVLLGEPGAVLDGGRRGTTVTLSAPGTTLAGFTVRNSGRSLDADDAAIKLVRCGACVVRDVRISEALHGVYLLESDRAAVVRTRVDGDPALAEPRRGNGIHLFNSQGCRVEGNTIRGARDGIYFAGSGHTRVAGNDVQQVRYGVHYMYSDDNQFVGNRFARNAAGAAIMSSRRIVFRDNHFTHHVGYRAYGILLQSAEDVVAERNRIEGNLVGLFLDASVRNVFRGNAIVGNGVGIDLMASAEDNLFTGNAVAGNRTPVRVVMGSGQNRWADARRGNYWGDPAVFDLDADGVGERPFRAGDAFASLAAARPVLEVFAGTPAARALSWAEEAFPVFGAPRVEDPAPLVAPPPGLPVARAPQRRPPGRLSAAAVLGAAAPLTLLALRRRRRRASES